MPMVVDMREEKHVYIFWYFKRWISVAKSKGMNIMFISVEYRE